MNAPVLANSQNLWSLLSSGGTTLYVLLICSLLSWGIIFERLWSFRKLSRDLNSFYTEAIPIFMRSDLSELPVLCQKYPHLPTAILITTALERLRSKDQRLRMKWRESVERKRQLLNQQMKRNLWILGTIGSAAPFIGLFGTVLGILQSFHEMAKTGSGGFAVVAEGISGALVATAAGIVVAVVAVMAYNAFQTKLGSYLLAIRIQIEEFSEFFSVEFSEAGQKSSSKSHSVSSSKMERQESLGNGT